MKLPSKKSKTQGDIVLPDKVGQDFVYGRVISVGMDVKSAGEGDNVIFDAMGQRPIELDPLKDSGIIVIHDTMVFATITDDELESRALPVP